MKRGDDGTTSLGDGGTEMIDDDTFCEWLVLRPKVVSVGVGKVTNTGRIPFPRFDGDEGSET